MPRFDGTGPLGYGPGTGWGMGPCGAGMGWRRGGGRGRGFGGRGFGWRRLWGGMGIYSAPKISKNEEAEMLTDEAAVLEEELKEIKARLAELKGKNK